MRSALLFAVVLSSCGARVVVTTTPTPTGGEIAEPAGDASVVVIRRPTEGRVLLQLWIDAGARDADAEVATLAALVAAARAGSGVSARVVPDGTSFEVVAAPGEHVAAIAALAAALVVREPSDAELGAARDVLTRRRRARASDVLGDAERLALSALAGDAAARFDPLAHADEPPAAAAVARFLADHYGPGRARLVAVGDAESAEIVRAFEDATRDAPAAARDRGERAAWARAGGERARADADASEPSFALALAVADSDRAVRIGEELASRLGSGGRVSVTPARPGTLVLASAPRALDVTTATALARVALGAPRGDGRARTSSAATLADAAGVSWAARGDGEVEEGFAFGVLGPGASALAGELSVALTAAPDVDVVVREVGGDSVGMAVVLLGGAADDSPSGHGRAAIVARALGEVCGRSVSAWSSPTSIELASIAPSADAPAALRALVDCALFSPIDGAALEAARRAALLSLDDGDVFLARAALALSPGTPGLVAPHGSPDGIAGATELERWLAEQRTAARARLGTTGEIARPGLTLGIGSGRAAVMRAGDPASEPVYVADEDVEVPEVIVTLRTDERCAPEVAALAASSLARSMSVGVLSVVHLAAGTDGFSWIAVGVRGPAEARDAMEADLPAWLARAEADARARLEAELAAAADARALLGADPLATARRAARGDVDVSDASAALRALFAADPHFVVVRPSPRRR